MSDSNWESLFEGRAPSLEWLNRLWKKAKCGEPQLAVILGETGLGKTRLVQEFYALLAGDTVQNPQAYYPPSLETGRNLALNPRPEQISTESAIPWLWWALRFQAPADRNQLISKSPFDETSDILLAHALPVYRLKNRKAAKVEAAMIFSTIAADLVSMGWYGSVLSLIEMMKLRLKDKRNADIPINEALAKRVEATVRRTIATLSMFMDSEQKITPTVPVILVLDDAQWIDPVTLNAIKVVFSLAVERNWPLLVICTHWEREWQSYEDTSGADVVAGNLRDVFKFFISHAAQMDNLLKLRTLEKEDLRIIALTALPGIEIDQVNRLVLEADGNPRAMEEMIRLLLGKPVEYFENADTQGKLTRKGIMRLARLSETSLYQKIYERYRELRVEMQDFLGAGSLLGDKFIRSIAADLAEQMIEGSALSCCSVAEVADDATQRFALTERFASFTDRFQQSVYRQVASAFLKEQDPKSYENARLARGRMLCDWSRKDQIKDFEDGERFELNASIVEVACEMSGKGLPPRDIAHAFDQVMQTLARADEFDLIANFWLFVLPHYRETWFVHVMQEMDYGPSHLPTTLTYYPAQSQNVMDLCEHMECHIDSLNPLRKIMWLEVLINFGQPLKSLDFLHEFYETNLSLLAKDGLSEDSLLRLGWYYSKQAQLLEALKDESAGDSYKKAIVTLTELIEMYGDGSSSTLRLISVVQQYGGFARDVEKNMKKALALFKQALILGREKFNKSPVTWESCLLLAETIALTTQLNYESSDDYAGDWDAHSEAIALTRRALSEAGETPVIVDQLAGLLYRAAHLQFTFHTDTAESFRFGKEAQVLFEQSIKKFGITAHRSYNLASTYLQLGDILENDNDLEQARYLFLKGSQLLDVDLVDGYLLPLERLNLRSKFLERLGLLAAAAGEQVEAVEYLNADIGVRLKIVEGWGQECTALMNHFQALRRFGLFSRDIGNEQDARTSFEQALNVASLATNKYEGNVEAMEAQVLALNNLIDCLLLTEDDTSVLEAYCVNAMALSQKLIKVNGETPIRQIIMSKLFQDLAYVALKMDSPSDLAENFCERAIDYVNKYFDGVGLTVAGVKAYYRSAIVGAVAFKDLGVAAYCAQNAISYKQMLTNEGKFGADCQNWEKLVGDL